jgi:hypothetical protein
VERGLDGDISRDIGTSLQEAWVVEVRQTMLISRSCSSSTGTGVGRCSRLDADLFKRIASDQFNPERPVCAARQASINLDTVLRGGRLRSGCRAFKDGRKGGSGQSDRISRVLGDSLGRHPIATISSDQRGGPRRGGGCVRRSPHNFASIHPEAESPRYRGGSVSSPWYASVRTSFIWSVHRLQCVHCHKSGRHRSFADARCLGLRLRCRGLVPTTRYRSGMGGQRQQALRREKGRLPVSEVQVLQRS